MTRGGAAPPFGSGLKDFCMTPALFPLESTSIREGNESDGSIFEQFC
jgi:hypothetical protein